MIKIDTKIIKQIHVNDFNFKERSPIELLIDIGEPICIYIPGKDNTRTRFLSTLIHGNEPSGYFGFLDWLKLEKTPAVDCYCLVSGVGAALTKPFFTQRIMISGGDLNRAFTPPYVGYEGQLAEEMMQLIEAVKPEGLVDIHNTSGHSPDFGICVKTSGVEFKLISMFTTKCMLAKLNLGALVEVAADVCSSVVVECGNANHPRANELALRGINTFFTIDKIDQFSPREKIAFLKDPIRLEIKKGTRVVYTNDPNIDADIILPPDIDKLNSEKIEADQYLAKVPKGTFDIFDFHTEDIDYSIAEYFYIKDNKLYAKIPMHLIMVTTNPVMAQNDCLFYVVRDTD